VTFVTHPCSPPIATTAAKDVARQSVIAGRPIQAADVTVTFPNSGAASFAVNPQVSVTVQNANLPTFFSRIWSRAALTVRATASAEGFNPSNSSSVGGGAGIALKVLRTTAFTLSLAQGPDKTRLTFGFGWMF
jgi:hypothetical protein